MTSAAPETGFADDEHAKKKAYSRSSPNSPSFAHALAEQLSEEAKPKQALFSHDGIDPMKSGLFL
jgi:hypothetical protein